MLPLRRWLPRGNSLPDDHWRRRHAGILVVLWLHALAVPIFGLVRGYALGHVAIESLIVPLTAVFASSPGIPRRIRTFSSSFGLLSASAILVHLSDGVIEMHFHYFVMVALVSLYQDWVPFLTATAYVFAQHAIVGAVSPRSVFNHPAAWNRPWTWAAIHALFIGGISITCLVVWRFNEQTLDQQRAAEDQLRLETEVVDTLQHVGRSLAAELDLQTVLQRVTDAATGLTAAEFGAFFYNETNEAGEMYQLYTLSGVGREAFANFAMPRATEVFAPTFAGERVVRYDDVTQEPVFGLSEPYYGMPPGHLPVRSYLAVPVKGGDGEVYGGLFFGHSQAGRFTDLHERLVVGVATHASVAIHNARLYESERHVRAAAETAGRRLAVLARAGQVLAGSLDLQLSLTNLAELVVSDLADSCAVYLDNGEGRLEQVAAKASYQPEQPMHMTWVDSTHPTNPIAIVARTGQAALFDNIDAATIDASIADPHDRSLVHGTEPTSAIIVALQGPTQLPMGALALGTVRQSGRRLAAPELELAEELARRTAVAIEHAQLYAAQRNLAETLQHSLLPETLPVVPGVAAAARYVAGGPDVEIGGDWYDVMAFGDGRLGVVMGDVVGRGVPAASLMGQIRNALRAYAVEHADPADVLVRLNSAVFELGPSQSMATLVYCVIDLDSATMRVANAGHPPPLVRVDGSEPVFVDGHRGPPLGALGYPSYKSWTSPLPPGSTLITYTDGLVEDRTMPLDVGLARMQAAIKVAPSDVEELCDHVMRATVGDRAGGDDSAIVAVRILPITNDLDVTLPRQPDVIRAVRSSLRRQLRHAGVGRREEFEILVAAGEACANAIQHAGPSSATFDFSSSVDDKQISIRVRDNGRWRVQRPADGGRGLRIMENFMDDVEVVRSEAGTEVVMRRSIIERDGVA